MSEPVQHPVSDAKEQPQDTTGNHERKLAAIRKAEDEQGK